MLTCDDIEIELSAYRDGALTPSERASVESHLATCAACKTALSQIEKVRSSLSALPKLKAPARLKPVIRDQIVKAQQPRPVARLTPVTRNRWVWPMGIAAAVLVSMLGYVTFFQSSGNDKQADFGLAQNLDHEDKPARSEALKKAAPTVSGATAHESIDSVGQDKAEKVAAPSVLMPTPVAPPLPKAAPPAPTGAVMLPPTEKDAAKKAEPKQTPIDEKAEEKAAAANTAAKAARPGADADRNRYAEGGANQFKREMPVPPAPPAAKSADKSIDLDDAPHPTPTRKSAIAPAPPSDPVRAKLQGVAGEEQQRRALQPDAPGLAAELRKAPEKPSNRNAAEAAKEASEAPAKPAEDRSLRRDELANGAVASRGKEMRTVVLRTRDVAAMSEKMKSLANGEGATVALATSYGKRDNATQSAYLVTVDQTKVEAFVNALNRLPLVPMAAAPIAPYAGKLKDKKGDVDLKEADAAAAAPNPAVKVTIRVEIVMEN